VKVTLVVVGRVRGPLEAAVRDYETRAGRYWKLEVSEVDPGAQGGGASAAEVREAEGARILARLASGTRVVALTREGKGMGSRALARFLGEAALHAHDVGFVIGGAFGLAPAVLARADRRLALSPMTLPHEMARLVLAEQLYRAGTILRNEPYHKGA
jgi:23S rRNA (pseudouridine1915-N3)-methyltransferase